MGAGNNTEGGEYKSAGRVFVYKRQVQKYIGGPGPSPGVHVSNPSTLEKEKFKVILGYVAGLRPPWTTEDLHKGQRQALFTKSADSCNGRNELNLT